MINALQTVSMAEQMDLVVCVLWAMGLGALIGMERQVADKPAGLRTHMLVAGAAALITSIGADMVGGAGGDPSRGLHAVITGIGFLGAGAIMQNKKEGQVGGLTTAATVFYVAAVGCAVPIGYGVAASVVTLLGVSVLVVLGLAQRKLRHGFDQRSGAREDGEGSSWEILHEGSKKVKNRE